MVEHCPIAKKAMRCCARCLLAKLPVDVLNRSPFDFGFPGLRPLAAVQRRQEVRGPVRVPCDASRRGLAVKNRFEGEREVEEERGRTEWRADVDVLGEKPRKHAGNP